MMPCVVIAGGSGFLGRSLARHLAGAGTRVALLSRTPPAEQGPWTHVSWDARTLGPWAAVLDGVSGLVNLSGRSVDCIKTPERRDQILRSRVESTVILGKALRTLSAPPPVWVQMSTAHIYGDPPVEVCDEESATGTGLAPEVGRAWEAAFDASCPRSVRAVILRTGFVIGRGGGALARLARLARLGLGGTLGHGRQGMSWIHELEMNRLFERGLVNPAFRGVYVASAPHPVSNAEFMRELRRACRVRIGLSAPAWLIRVGAPLVMRTDPELALYGRYVVSSRLAREGFAFRFSTLREALADLMAAPGGRL